MLPTIDISLIGILITVWHVVLVIWDYMTRALNWITQRALSLMIGSRMWATIFLCSAVALILVAARSMLGVVEQYVGQLAISSVNSSAVRDSISVLVQIFPVDQIFSLLNTILLGSVAIRIVESSALVFGWYLKIFGMLSRAFKM